MTQFQFSPQIIVFCICIILRPIDFRGTDAHLWETILVDLHCIPSEKIYSKENKHSQRKKTGSILKEKQSTLKEKEFYSNLKGKEYYSKRKEILL